MKVAMAALNNRFFNIDLKSSLLEEAGLFAREKLAT